MKALYVVATKWISVLLAPAAVPVAGLTYLAVRPVAPVAVVAPATAKPAGEPVVASAAADTAPMVLTLGTTIIESAPRRLAPRSEWVCASRATIAGRLRDVVHASAPTDVVKECGPESAIGSEAAARTNYSAMHLRR